MKLPAIPEEVAFWLRSAAFAIVIATIYWFVTYEWAGTVLLGLFGLGSTFAFAFLGRAVMERSQGGPVPQHGVGDPTAGAEPDGPFGDERGRIPTPTFAPFVLGVGLAVAALGLAFGPWLLLAALVPIAVAGGSWLGSVAAELRATEREDPE